MIYEYSQTNRIENPHTYMYTEYEGEPFLEEYLKTREECSKALKDRYELIFENANHNSSLVFNDPAKLEALYILSCLSLYDDVLVQRSKKLIEKLHHEQLPEFSNVKMFNHLGILRGANLFSSNVIIDVKLIHKWLAALKDRQSVAITDILSDLSFIIIHSNKTDLKNVYPIISKFVKKYEVFKRIFTLYEGKTLKKIDDHHRASQGYIQLAVNFALFYFRTKNQKFLNGTLKINDAICSIEQELNSVSDILLAYASINLEIDSIRSLMQEKGL